MIVKISGDAEADIADGYWFYEKQELGLGDYFRSCVLADIDTLAALGGIHESLRLPEDAHEAISIRHLLRSQRRERYYRCSS